MKLLMLTHIEGMHAMSPSAGVNVVPPTKWQKTEWQHWFFQHECYDRTHKTHLKRERDFTIDCTNRSDKKSEVYFYRLPKAEKISKMLLSHLDVQCSNMIVVQLKYFFPHSSYKHHTRNMLKNTLFLKVCLRWWALTACQSSTLTTPPTHLVEWQGPRTT